ncbi:MAG: 23S rRNA (adenine(2503)-C(2))-methyltransferase RlmN [Candidatus Aegiribacteria sp.]|nr:23S rRNA (adenine(2503)-C(2))-methyltransferase RlmN [Candidatus Aegiribacteria sp.]
MQTNGSLKEHMVKISGLTYPELKKWVTFDLGMKPYRAQQLFSWIHLRRVNSFHQMTDISLSARNRFEEICEITALETCNTITADDGTVKYSFTLDDGEVIESVLIPDPPRLTACISTQAGCRCGCTFCQTGRGGFRRNLRTDEIVAQLYGLQNGTDDRISNVVFMGMGEPMDNFPALRDALSIISDDRGICIGARKITISTVGIPGGIEKLTQLDDQYGLAVSLHSAVESTRLKLVPVSKTLPLRELKKAMKDYISRKGRRITIEYCLIAGINDTREEASALAEFTGDIECKINLLVYNPVEGAQYRRPEAESVNRFMRYLYPRCQAVMLRRSRGSDIAAACGQLGPAARND